MPPPLIGLTGPAGSGKTLAAQTLAALGFQVFSLDDAAHRILDDTAVKPQLVSEFSTAIIRVTDGTVSRKKLGKIVFSDREELLRLNAIVHPPLAEAARRWMEDIRERGVPGVVEGALVYELGLAPSLDAVILVDAPVELRVRRLERSRGWDINKLRFIDAAQLPLEDKISRGALPVRNTGAPFELSDRIKAILEEKHWLPTTK